MEYQKALEEKHYQEAREDKKERWKLSKELSNGNGKFPESSEKVSTPVESFQKVSDWRKVRTKLSRKQLESLANASPAEMQEMASRAGVTYKTISNWRQSAKKELEQK
jgi:hypothetical protein